MLRIVFLVLLAGSTWVCWDAGWRSKVRPPVRKTMRRHFWPGLAMVTVVVLDWLYELSD